MVGKRLTTSRYAFLCIGQVFQHLDFVGDNSQISLSLTSSNDFILFDPISRNLSVKQQLNVTAAGPSISLYISCTVLASGVTTAYTVIIDVADTNRYPPVFVNAPYAVNVSEVGDADLQVLGT